MPTLWKYPIFYRKVCIKTHPALKDFGPSISNDINMQFIPFEIGAVNLFFSWFPKTIAITLQVHQTKKESYGFRKFGKFRNGPSGILCPMVGMLGNTCEKYGVTEF